MSGTDPGQISGRSSTSAGIKVSGKNAYVGLDYKGASVIRENTHEDCSDDEDCNHKKGYFNQDFYNLLICTLGLFVCGTLTGLM